MHRFLFNDICKWDKKKDFILKNLELCLHPSMTVLGIIALLSVGVVALFLVGIVAFFLMGINAPKHYPKGD